MEHLDDQELKCVLAVNSEGSVSKAVEKLNRTQPSISRTIMNLEDKLNVKIFDREKTPWKVTNIGGRVMKHAKERLALDEQFFSDIREMKSQEDNTIKLGLMPFESRYYLPKILDNLKETNTYLEHTTKPSQEMERLLIEGKADFVFINNFVDNPAFTYIPIKNYAIYVIMSKNHLLAKTYPDNTTLELSLLDFKNDNFILLDRTHVFHKDMVNFCKKAGFEPKILQEVMAVELAVTLAQADHGITFALETVVERHPQKDEVCCFKLAELEYPLALVHHKNRKLNEKESKFVELVKQIFTN